MANGRTTVAGRCVFLFQGYRLGELTRVPARVPRELPGVKSKAHNMLWISAPDHRMSHRLCSQWPKYTCEDLLRGRKNRESYRNCSANGAEKQDGLRRELVHQSARG